MRRVTGFSGSAQANRSRAAVPALILAMFASCSSAGTEIDTREASAATIETEAELGSPAPAPPETTVASADSDSSAPGASPADSATDLAGLTVVIGQTVARRSASFELEVAQTLPVPGQNAASTIRSGSFDEELLHGFGSLRFETESEELAQLFGGAADFEFRLTEDVYWSFNPLAEFPGWIGYDVYDFAEASGGDTTLAMDGDLFLLAFMDAAIEVTDHTEGADGSTVWTVGVRAD